MAHQAAELDKWIDAQPRSGGDNGAQSCRNHKHQLVRTRRASLMNDHSYSANLIWRIADLLRGPYRPPQYERVMLPMTVLRRFDCVVEPTKGMVVPEYERSKSSRLTGDALNKQLNKVAGERFHNHPLLDFEKLKGDPDNIDYHLVSHIKGFSPNVQRIFEYFEFEAENDRNDVRPERKL